MCFQSLTGAFQMSPSSLCTLLVPIWWSCTTPRDIVHMPLLNDVLQRYLVAKGQAKQARTRNLANADATSQPI